MSKYNLTDILNEYIGGGRIGTLKISFKDLQDKMDELEDSGKVIVRTLSGPSGDGKVNRDFDVVDRDSAVQLHQNVAYGTLITMSISALLSFLPY